MAKSRKHTPRATSKARSRSSTPLDPRWYDALIALLLAAATLMAYAPALENGLVNWDDNYYLTDSPYLKDLGWNGIKAIFTAYHMGNYHPLPLLSYAIEYALVGLDPRTMHTTNVLLHAINTVLVFMLGARLLGLRWAGIIMALLFALHPMHVESVAWLSERKDVLYTAFFLLALLSYIGYVRKGGARSYLLVLVFFALALLSKSAAVAFAPLLFVVDYFEGRSWNKARLLEKLPFFALALVFGLVALASQKTAMEASFAPQFPLWQRPLIVGYALGYYLVSFVWPYRLSAIHPYPALPGEGLQAYLLPATAVFVLALASVVLLLRFPAHRRIVITSVLFFLLTIATVLQVIPVGRAIMAERYTYVPYIGLSLLVAHGILARWNAPGNVWVRRGPAMVLAVLLLAYTVQTRERIPVWRTSFTLFDDVLRTYPEDGLIYYNRGLTYYYQGDHKRAIQDYDACIRYRPEQGSAYFNRGLAYKELGDMQAVVRDMDAAIAHSERKGEAYQNRGNAKAMMKDYAGSIADLDSALVLLPNDTAILMNRGLSKLFSGQADAACADWRLSQAAGSRQAVRLVAERCP